MLGNLMKAPITYTEAAPTAIPVATRDNASAGIIARAYEHCRRITRKHAKTFYFASLFLPPHKRRACYTVYAFCRYMDDLIDERMSRTPGEVDEREVIDHTITRWQQQLDRVYQGEYVRTAANSDDALVMIAWADTLERYHIDRHLPDVLIEGVMMDLRSSVRFDTFEQLHAYCYKVASVVGLMTSEIFGYDHPDALEQAVDLGVAMQLTNILRDVGEDYSNNRIYLPREEMEMFGVDEAMIARGEVCEEWRRLMRFQIDRAHGYYLRANRGILRLEPDSQLTVQLMSHNYRRILDAIERNDYDVFTRRASTSLMSKVLSIPKLAMRH
jgi:phytoene synthase